MSTEMRGLMCKLWHISVCFVAFFFLPSTLVSYSAQLLLIRKKLYTNEIKRIINKFSKPQLPKTIDMCDQNLYGSFNLI